MSKILKLYKLYNLIGPESVNNIEMSLEDLIRDFKLKFTDTHMSEEVNEWLRYIDLIYYNQLSEEDLDSLIRICDNRRVGRLIGRLMNASADAVEYGISKGGKLESSEIPAAVKESFDKELEELLS